MEELERRITEYYQKYGIKKIIKGGLGSFAECFYLGMAPTKNSYTEFDDIVQIYGLTFKERAIWEQIWRRINKEFNEK